MKIENMLKALLFSGVLLIPTFVSAETMKVEKLATAWATMGGEKISVAAPDSSGSERIVDAPKGLSGTGVPEVYYTDGLNLDTLGNFGLTTAGSILVGAANPMAARFNSDGYYKKFTAVSGWQPVYYLQTASGGLKSAYRLGDGLAHAGVFKFKPTEYDYGYLDFKNRFRDFGADLFSFEDDKQIMTADPTKAKNKP